MITTNFIDKTTVVETDWLNDVDAAVYQRGQTSATVPITGSHLLGDIVWNSAPTAEGFVGWVCIAAGTPGTWKTFGAITA